MFLAVIIWLTACKSADQATADNRSTLPPPPALEEVTVSASKDTRSRPATTRGAAKKKAAERPMPTPPPPPRITTTSSGYADAALEAPRTAEPPPPPPATSPSGVVHLNMKSVKSIRKSESRVRDGDAAESYEWTPSKEAKKKPVRDTEPIPEPKPESLPKARQDGHLAGRPRRTCRALVDATRKTLRRTGHHRRRRTAHQCACRIANQVGQRTVASQNGQYRQGRIVE